MKTYLHFNDPKADRYLLREIESEDRQRRLNAAFLARNSSSAEVHQALLALLENNTFDPEFEVRTIIIKSLATIGDPQFLPILRRVLQGRSLLHPTLFKQYKTLIIQSFDQYPVQDVQPILNALAVESKGEFVDFARSVLSRLTRKGV